MRFIVLTDSAADISDTRASELEVDVLRFPVIVDDVDYIENTTISIDEFIDSINEGKSVKTSQPSVGSLISKWDELLEKYDHVIHCGISEGLSGAYETALIQSKNYVDKVTVIKTSAVSVGLQYMCKKVVGLLKEGMQPNEIKNIIENDDKMFAFIIPDNLTYLSKGGRISPQAAALGNLLKIVPILVFKDGEIDAFDKVRTNKKAYKRALDYFKDEIINKDDYNWYVIHSDNLDNATLIASELSLLTNSNVEIFEFKPVILAHTGPRTIGIGYMRK